MNQISPDKLSLLELQLLVKQAIEVQLPLSYWVVAEINELKENASGHCYLELVQQDESSSFVQAKVSATIWSYSYRMLRPFFESSTGQRLSPGLKVLVKATVQYHQLYGMSLNITDIDPSYTVGELQLQRRKTVQQLKDDGVFDMNRELELPLLPQRIAVISSPTAAGYQDFMEHLHNNVYGYTFSTMLFPALVQGRDAEESLLSALDKVFAQIDSFDAVAIIRGGGSQTDLLCFDSYRLAYHLAQLPIPVLTGIGHDKDESVVDLVAHTMLKTPTAVADFLVEQMVEREQELNMLAEQLNDQTLELLSEQQGYLNNIRQSVAMQAERFFDRERQRLTTMFGTRLKTLVFASFKENKYKLALTERTLEANDPQRILSKGYAIAVHNGQRLTNANSVKAGENLKLILSNGQLNVTVEK